MGIPFIQYLRPNGRRAEVSIDRSDEIEALAHAFLEKGGRFECEELTTGHASFTAVFMLEDGEDDVAIEVVRNGAAVPEAVDRLIRKATAAVA